jgi:MYXO-CTERM domain-containing protein
MTAWRPRERASWSFLYGVLSFGLIACGGGGCGGCGDGCGVAPIPGGFPIEQRVPNSAQVRLTDEGIGFLENNADALVALALPDGLTFPIERQEISAGITITICEDNDCAAQAEIQQLRLIPGAPNQLEVRLRLILDSRNLAGMRDRWDGTCDLDLDSRRGSREYVGLTAVIALAEETEAARRGYTKVEVVSVGLTPGEDIENDDIRVSGGFLGSCAALNLGFIKGFIIDLVSDQLGGLVQGAIDDQLCTTQGEYGCPTGTFAVPAGDDPEAVCRYAASGDAACVPMLLGTDGQGDLGAAFLGSVSPGTHAPGQFLLAAGGNGEAVNEGMSVFMYGGFLGTSRDFATVYPHNPCVPVIEPPAIPTIPRAAVFRANTVEGLASDPHVGIGLSEDFLNHAGYGAFDAGLLCIGAGTSLSQQLSSGLFSLLVPSLNRLTFPESSVPLAVMLRPQRPPTFEIGAGTEDEPLLTVLLDDLQVDFYVWSNERYVRFMTYQADLSLGINLAVMDGEIVPNVVGLTATESTVTNYEDLLDEDPERLAGVIQSVLETFAGMAFGDLGGFALPELMGLELQVQEGGVRGVAEGESEFLGIFANLAVAGAEAFSAPVDTRLALGALELDHRSMTLEHWGDGALPRLHVDLSAEGPSGAELEYSVRLDGMAWSAWTRDPHVVIEDAALRFQARHVVEARARVVGERDSVDLSPAVEQVLVDITAPDLELVTEAEGTRIAAWDVLAEHLDYRWRLVGDSSWSEWERLGDRTILPVLGDVEVEVRDEAENVASASSGLIRGVGNPNAEGGCGSCAVDSPTGGAKGTFVAFLAVLGAMLARRRQERRKEPRRGRSFRAMTGRSFLLFTLPVLLAVTGCDCGGKNPPADLDGGVPEDGEVPTDGGMLRPLEPGLMAMHLDMTALTDGTLVLSGYSPGALPSTRYGDLVVGSWNGTSVSWEIVDGVPDVAPTRDPASWRGGIVDEGDDVGLYTSIVNDGGTLVIAYHDRTNGALKVASGTLGGEWSVTEVDGDGAQGYTSLVRTSSGWAVSYLAITPPAMLPGRPISQVRVATASSPGGPWTVAEVTGGPIACRPQFCGSADCLATGECTNDAGEAEVLPDPYVEDLPPAIGLHTSLAATSSGLALVYYSRAEGNLYGVSFEGGAWGTPFLIDGYGVGDPNTGDCGLHASLAVDAAGVWHVAYVDGAEEALKYARIEGMAITREIVDDGETEGSTDGRHVVGDDADIAVTASGEVRIAYQDATRQDARFARKASGGAWAVTVIDENDSTGYFTTQYLAGSASSVAFWFRQEASTARSNGIRVETVE